MIFPIPEPPPKDQSPAVNQWRYNLVQVLQQLVQAVNNLGSPGEIVAGMWTFVERKTLAVDTASPVIFTGLDGDAARRYKLVFCGAVKAAGDNPIGVFPNSDFGANYNYLDLVCSNSGATPSQVAGSATTYGMFLTVCREAGTFCFAEMEIYSKVQASVPRYSHSKGIEVKFTGGGNPQYSEDFCCEWANTTDKITSLAIDTTGGAGITFASGSEFELWKVSG